MENRPTHPEEPPHNTQKGSEKSKSITISGINNILGVNNITQIDNGGPNHLVPNGLFYNEISKKLFEYLKDKGIKYYLDTLKKSEVGYSDKDNKYIFLGLKTPRSYTKNMGIADSVNEDIKTQLVFLHEMCHHLAWDLFDNYQSFKDLFKICMKIREKHPNNGIAKLADMKFYQLKGTAAQATEDCVELLRIYFMCREDESMCLEYIKNKLNYFNNEAHTIIFNLLSQNAHKFSSL